MTDQTRDDVRRRYAAAASQTATGHTSGVTDDRFGGGQYGDDDEVPESARLASLGCGNPTAIADLQPGDVVLDLGSGGGLDVLLSARRVGPDGFAYGLDMTPEMLDLARHNSTEAGAVNVEFLEGTIEHIPFPDSTIDVIISNCVINLSTNKSAVFTEMRRVLRPGGRIGVSDIVADDDLTIAERIERGSAVGSTVGALSISDYRTELLAAGFENVAINTTQLLGDGVHAAIIQASTPPAARTGEIRTRRMIAADWVQVRSIYEAGIATGNATFETTAPTWEKWDASHLANHRLVAEDADGTIVGWASLTAVSDRCAYAGVAENSVYIHPEHRGRGVGRRLMDGIIESAEAAGYWTIQTGIFPENIASIGLHERFGFRILGRRERIGQLNGVWRDTLILERRSTSIGA